MGCRLPIRCLAGLLAAIGLMACKPYEPLDRPITAATALSYHSWQYRHLSRLAPDARREFTSATQQLLLALQVREAGRRPQEFQVRLRQILHGRTARDVIAEGYRLRLERLASDNRADDFILSLNEVRVLSDEIPAETAAYLASRMGGIKARQMQRLEEIAWIETRLAQLVPFKTPPPTTAPDPRLSPFRRPEKPATL